MSFQNEISLQSQILIILLGFLGEFSYVRALLYGVKLYQLNRSAYKKRKKGETFKEWMFYDRWKNEIPKILLIYYYAIGIVHVVGLIVCCIFHMLYLKYPVDTVIAKGIVYLDFACIMIIGLLFRGRESGMRYGIRYERWIVKRRGQKPKRPK